MKATSPPHTALSWSSSRCSTRSHNCDTHSRPSHSHFLHRSPASRALGNETAHSRICDLPVRPGYSDVGDVVFVFASHLKVLHVKIRLKYWERNRRYRGLGTYCFDGETVQCFILWDVAIRVCYWLQCSQKVKVYKVKSRTVGDQWVECLCSG